MIIIVFGLPGSGKSYFAEKLAARLKASYLSSDILRKSMYQSPKYSEQQKQIIYNEMLQQMKSAMREKRDMVLDATFYKDEIRRQFSEEGRTISRFFFIELKAAESVIRERLKMQRRYSDADHLILYSDNNNINEMLEQTINFLHS